MADMSGEWASSQQPAEGGRGSGGKRRGLLIGAVALGVLLLGASAAFTFQALSGGGSQPDSAMPAGALGFARVDLDPSADQKINAVRLLRRVPEFEQTTGISSDRDDLRKKIYEAVVEDAEESGTAEDCPDYKDGVEPWLGDRVGFGAMPAEDSEEPDGLVAVQVSDQDAAKDGIEKLAACGGESSVGVAFVGDYALIAETQQLADDFAADAEESPLSENADYLADMDAAGGSGIVSGWANVEALIDESLNEEERVTAEAFGLGRTTSIAMAMSAGSDSLEFAVAANGEALTDGSGTTSFAELPASTMFGFGFTGGSELVQKGWEQAQKSLEGNESFDAQELADMVQAETGFVVPDDVATLFGDDFVLAMDAEAVELGPTGEPDPSTVRVGMRTSSDLAEIQVLTTRLESALATAAPVDLIERESDRGTVVAATEEYADALADEDGLADSANYREAVADHDSATAVFFMDFDLMLKFVDDLGEQNSDPMSADERKTFEVLRAFGVSGARDGDYTLATVRLVFD